MVQTFKTRTDASHGKFGHVLVDRLVVSAQVTNVNENFDRDKAKGAGLGSKVQNNLPGIADGTIELDMKMGESVERKLARYKNRMNTFTAMVASKGLNPLTWVTAAPCTFGKYGRKWGVEDEVTVNCEMLVAGDYHEGPLMVSPLTVTTVTTGAFSGPVDDNGANGNGGVSTYGGTIYIIVYDIVAGTTPTVTFTLSDSADNSVFTPITGSTSAVCDPTVESSMVQTIELPSTQTLRRYTKITGTATGTPTGVQAAVVVGRDYNPVTGL